MMDRLRFISFASGSNGNCFFVGNASQGILIDAGIGIRTMDEELNARLNLTSANSINVARFLPQAFYYFNAYAQLKKQGKADNLVICVPSGNFGNITAGLFGKRMGLPVERFIAANNQNDIFLQYLETGKYAPRPSVATIANAMS